MAARSPTPSAEPPRSLWAGFTLIELVISIAVMAVLGAIAMPNLSALLSRQRLQAAAHHLQADVALARQESGRRGQLVQLQFEPGADWCYVISTGVGTGTSNHCRTATPAPGNGVIKVVHAADHPGIELLEASTMLIDAGSSGALPLLRINGQARFGNREGQQLQVRLGPQGRASLCASGVAVGGVPVCPV